LIKGLIVVEQNYFLPFCPFLFLNHKKFKPENFLDTAVLDFRFYMVFQFFLIDDVISKISRRGANPVGFFALDGDFHGLGIDGHKSE
jgi:hypothetical protein